MIDAPQNILSLSTVFDTTINVNLDYKYIHSTGGVTAFFETLTFDDELELINCYKTLNGCHVNCGCFQVLPNDFVKLREQAKVLDLLT